MPKRPRSKRTKGKGKRQREETEDETEPPIKKPKQDTGILTLFEEDSNIVTMEEIGLVAIKEKEEKKKTNGIW